MCPIRREIKVFDSAEQLTSAAAEFFTRVVKEAAQARGKALVALSGGSTPKALYARLAKIDLPWSAIHLYWGDERYVPADDARSNYHMTREALLAHVAIPEENVHRVPTEAPSAAAAAFLYGAQLREARLDLALLGLGADGHTASLFPGVALPKDGLAAGFHVPAVGMDRVTLLPSLLNASRDVLFLVTGAEKKEVAERILRGEGDYPARLIAPTDGQLTWFFDRAAAPETA